MYKQGVSEGERKEIAGEESLFMTCLAPVQMVVENTGEPSSVYYCWQLRIQYATESKQLVMTEYQSFKDAELAPTIREAGLLIKLCLEVSMIDGKVSCI